MDKISRYRAFTWILGVTAIALLILAASSGPAAADMGENNAYNHQGWMGMHDGFGGWMGGGFGFLWMFVWPLVFLGIPLLIGYLLLSNQQPDEQPEEKALEVLRRRYAQGEIDDEEFESRRRTLNKE
jgi:putative membrane protein